MTVTQMKRFRVQIVSYPGSYREFVWNPSGPLDSISAHTQTDAEKLLEHTIIRLVAEEVVR